MAHQVHVSPPLGVLTHVREPVMSFRVYFVLDSNVLFDGKPVFVQNAEVWSNIFDGAWRSIAMHTEGVFPKPEHEHGGALESELAFVNTSHIAGLSSRIQGFGLDLPVSSSMEKTFEFTVRWRDSRNGTWHWAGGLGQNARVSLTHARETDPCRPRAPLPNFWRQRLRSAFQPKDSSKDDLSLPVAVADSWHMSSTGASCLFKPAAAAEAKSEKSSSVILGRLADIRQYLAFVRKDPFWIIPHTGNGTVDTGSMDIVLLLVELEPRAYLALMPFVRGPNANCVAVLRPRSNTGILTVATGHSVSCGSIRVAAAINTRPYDAVEELFARIQQCLPFRSVPNVSKRNSPSKHLDTMLDALLQEHMGYCTWNAFYQQVSHHSVVSTLKTMRDASIAADGPFPAWVAIDDGWQSVSTYDGFGQLYDIYANSEKFPGQLKQTVDELLSLGIKRVGVWHALWGYWGGINPQGPLAKRYKIEKYHRMRSSVAEECDIWLIASCSINQFYSDFYSWLGSQGISFVKVDYQAAFETLQGYPHSDGKIGGMYSAYLDAMEQAAHDHLGPGSVIHCMAQSPHVIMRALQQTTQQSQNSHSSSYFSDHALFRNSDDYFPDVPSSHGWHIYCNMANAVWTRFLRKRFSADWDMFQPGRQGCDIHAASRALSGGPVYITGSQNDYDAQKLSQYVGNSGLIAAVEPPLLDIQCLFTDMTATPRILVSTTYLPDAEATSVSVFNTTANSLISPISLARVYADRLVDTSEQSQQMLQPGSAISSNSNASNSGNNPSTSSNISEYYAIYQQSTNRVLMVPTLPTTIAIALQPLGSDLISVFRMAGIRSGDRGAILYAACLGDTSRFVSASVVERSVYGVLPRPSSIGSNSSLSSNYTPPASPSIYSSRQWNVRVRVAYQPSVVAFALLAVENTSLARRAPSIVISSVRVSGYEVPDSHYSFSKTTGMLIVDTSSVGEMTSVPSITITLAF
ncbi:hypothetical protein H4R99_002944 [Coemansia sp. RSA 1722]|nr:hypothetical protein LPJ57_003893 [Coemansia sp. RSA 486]KAJ2234197.1 hypothetical protein IWW45_003587 [Coemansia sp. RSA 485]KAJ2601617.1 hypothetical protein H4R99_002944 [Coemansia sp. RSA 1722]